MMILYRYNHNRLNFNNAYQKRERGIYTGDI